MSGAERENASTTGNTAHQSVELNSTADDAFSATSPSPFSPILQRSGITQAHQASQGDTEPSPPYHTVYQNEIRLSNANAATLSSLSHNQLYYQASSSSMTSSQSVFDYSEDDTKELTEEGKEKRKKKQKRPHRITRFSRSP